MFFTICSFIPIFSCYFLLVLFSDSEICQKANKFPCYSDDGSCYELKDKCDGKFFCKDGADELDCE